MQCHTFIKYLLMYLHLSLPQCQSYFYCFEPASFSPSFLPALGTSGTFIVTTIFTFYRSAVTKHFSLWDQ